MDAPSCCLLMPLSATVKATRSPELFSFRPSPRTSPPVLVFRSTEAVWPRTIVRKNICEIKSWTGESKVPDMSDNDEEVEEEEEMVAEKLERLEEEMIEKTRDESHRITIEGRISSLRVPRFSNLRRKGKIMMNSDDDYDRFPDPVAMSVDWFIA